MDENTNHVRHAIRTAQHSITQLIVELNALYTTLEQTGKQMDKDNPYDI